VPTEEPLCISEESESEEEVEELEESVEEFPGTVPACMYRVVQKIPAYVKVP